MQQVGRHSFRAEGDVVYVKYVAAVTLDEVKQMTALSQPATLAAATLYLVYDVSEAGLMTPEARRYVAEQSKSLQITALVIHGATLFTRAAIALVLSAVRLLGRDVPLTVYVNSEPEARAWIAAHRQKSGPK